MYGCESWTIKKAERQKIDAFELWYWRRLLRVPWTARRSNQSILKEISPGCSLGGLMLKLKLQYFGHLMWRADSLEKTLMLGGIGGKRRRGQQRVRWPDGITDLMGMSFSKLQELVMDREVRRPMIHGVANSWTRLSDWTDWLTDWLVRLEPYLSSCPLSCFPGSPAQKTKSIKPESNAERKQSSEEPKFWSWTLLALSRVPPIIKLCDISQAYMDFPGGSDGKECAYQWRSCKRDRLDLQVREIPGGGRGNSLQYSCLKNPMDRGAWKATVHRLAKNWTHLKWFSTHSKPMYQLHLQSWHNNKSPVSHNARKVLSI